MTKLLIEDLDITIAIPTYNGASRLPQVLEKLLTQTGVENIKWEIVVINNNSSDNTYAVIQNYQKIFNLNCPLRYFIEPMQGIPFARQRAVSEARGKFIAFIDDDNLPAPDWVLAAYTFGKEHPLAGAWSGQIHGEYEVEPPKNFEKIQAFLAIREHGSQAYLFEPNNLRLPPGAGLVVRKKAWCEAVPSTLSLHGRLPGLFVAGDDYEALLYIHKANWDIWYNPAMHINHRIPHWRLEKDYLLTLARGCGLCTCQLRFINTNKWQKPIVFFRTFLSNLHRLIQHFINYKIQLADDIILRFEIEFYLGSMMSPLYWLKCYLNRVFQKV